MSENTTPTARIHPNDLDTVKTQLIEIVSEYPDGHTYFNSVDGDLAGGVYGCRYVHYDKPGCLIGQLLHRFYGWSLAELACYEGQGVHAILGDQDDVVRYLRYVQERQDRGMTWKDAIEGFDPNTYRSENEY